MTTSNSKQGRCKPLAFTTLMNDVENNLNDIPTIKGITTKITNDNHTFEFTHDNLKCTATRTYSGNNNPWQTDEYLNKGGEPSNRYNAIQLSFNVDDGKLNFLNILKFNKDNLDVITKAIAKYLSNGNVDHLVHGIVRSKRTA